MGMPKVFHGSLLHSPRLPSKASMGFFYLQSASWSDRPGKRPKQMEASRVCRVLTSCPPRPAKHARAQCFGASQDAAPPLPKRTRFDLNKCIDPDYYGYRDEDDGAPPPFLQPRSAVASLLAMPGA